MGQWSILFLALNRSGRIPGRQKCCRQVVPADGVKTDGSAATDGLFVRMVGAMTRIFIRPHRDYSRSANVNKQFPALTATYCLPPTEYVIGPEMTAAPRDVFRSSAPVRASKA